MTPHRRSVLITTALALLPSVAMAQPAPSLEETFRALGEQLGRVERALEAPSASSVGSGQVGGIGQAVLTSSTNLPVGAQAATATAVVAQGGPPGTAAPQVELPRGTTVRVEGREQGFLRVTAIDGPRQGQTVWIRDSGVFDWIIGYTSSRVAKAVEEAGKIAASVRDNPYIRLKGFKVNVAAPPSLEVEFEMKGDEQGKPK